MPKLEPGILVGISLILVQTARCVMIKCNCSFLLQTLNQTTMESVRNKPLRKKELLSAITRSLSRVCYSLKYPKKYVFHQQSITLHSLFRWFSCSSCFQATLMLSAVLQLSPVSPLPQNLQSLLPLDPIEAPPTWAWADHPRQGFSYKAKDGISVEVCLQNPKLIATAKCQLPLDVCLANPEYIAQVGCSGNTWTPTSRPD